MDWATLAVEKLEHDILDRRGLKHEWAMIDEDVLGLIRERWAEILREALDEAYRLGIGAL